MVSETNQAKIQSSYVRLRTLVAELGMKVLKPAEREKSGELSDVWELDLIVSF